MDRVSEFVDILFLMYPQTEFQVDIDWNQEETCMANISSAK